MNKMIMNRLTMLAVTLMASMACFAQGKGGEATGWTADSFGPNFQELKYNVTIGGPHQVSVIGFADGILANPKWIVTPPDDPEVTIVPNTVTIFHYLPGDTSVPAVLNLGVEANAFKSVDAEIVPKVTKLSIEYVNNGTTQGDPVIIGENAFSGLTSLATVISAIPGNSVQAIPPSAFATITYRNATLKVPAGSLKAYAKATGWNSFKFVSDGTSLLGDVSGDKDLTNIDALLILKRIKDAATYSEIADLNGDNSVTNIDVLLLLKKIKQ